MTRLRATCTWPVCWDTMTALAAATNRQPEELADYPLLAAHRVLDRLASMAFDGVDGVFGAAETFVGAVAELCRAVPDLAPEMSAKDLAPRGFSFLTTLGVDEEYTGPRSASPLSEDSYSRNRSLSDAAGAAASDTLINSDGVSALVELAFQLTGRQGAQVIRQLSEIAVRAERLLLGMTYPRDRGYLADVSVLAGTAEDVPDAAKGPSVVDQRDQPWWSPQDRTHIADLVRTAPSICSVAFERVSEDDFLTHPPPEVTPLSTTGIQRVEVADPCGASPVMTIYGSGFGAAPAAGVGVIAATWDATTSRVVYRKVAVSSWSDQAVVAQLPSNVVSGVAAFADLDAIADYNSWAKDRNLRVTQIMHGRGCPGNWIAENTYSEIPTPVAAAQYTAGGPRIIADVAPTDGPPELWNSRTLHLQTGQAFRIAWQSFGADTVTLRALDGGASAILAAAGYGSSVAGLDTSSGQLVLPATANPVRATFGVEAGNGCGAARAPVAVVVTGAPFQSASLAVFQAVAGGDVTVTVQGASEVLDPPSGSTIPLVASKRSVAVVDWWGAVPQMPPGEVLTATATLKVSGPLVGYPGVTLRPSALTSDAAPPDDPVELPSGPAFASPAAYQQWIAMGNNPQTFNVVLPAEVCLGGEIPGTSVQGWTVLGATVEVSSQDGPSWTVMAGNNVTFYPRRRVRIRYRAWGQTPSVPAPSDQVCRDALRAAGSLLPIPDPEIVALPGSPVEQNGHLIEDLVAERGTPTPAWRDEIWLVVGPQNTGGYSPGPWVGATDCTGPTAAHEICHLFGQNHLALCGIAGDPSSSFPNGGNVVVPGFDMWNSVFVRNARDIMVRTYCPEPTWQSPERWRRVFLQVSRS